jgi:hypothetical protein
METYQDMVAQVFDKAETREKFEKAILAEPRDTHADYNR